MLSAFALINAAIFVIKPNFWMWHSVESSIYQMQCLFYNENERKADFEQCFLFPKNVKDSGTGVLKFHK